MISVLILATLVLVIAASGCSKQARMNSVHKGRHYAAKHSSLPSAIIVGSFHRFCFCPCAASFRYKKSSSDAIFVKRYKEGKEALKSQLP